MITATCQRWRERRDSYRPAGEVIATNLYEVAPIVDDRTAKAFVERHHYASLRFARFFTCSYSASRMRSLRVNIRPGWRSRSSSTSRSSSAISAFGMRMLNWISSAGLGFRGTSTA